MSPGVISGLSLAPRDRVYVITDFRYGRFWDIPFPVAASNLSPKEADSDTQTDSPQS